MFKSTGLEGFRNAIGWREGMQNEHIITRGLASVHLKELEGSRNQRQVFSFEWRPGQCRYAKSRSISFLGYFGRVGKQKVQTLKSNAQQSLTDGEIKVYKHMDGRPVMPEHWDDSVMFDMRQPACKLRRLFSLTLDLMSLMSTIHILFLRYAVWDIIVL